LVSREAEGKKNQTTLFTFTVTLSAAYDQTVTMSFRTVDGTAKTSDQDYVAQTGTLTFKPGETTKTITIEVKGDSKKEADATFSASDSIARSRAPPRQSGEVPSSRSAIPARLRPQTCRYRTYPRKGSPLIHLPRENAIPIFKPRLGGAAWKIVPLQPHFFAQTGKGAFVCVLRIGLSQWAGLQDRPLSKPNWWASRVWRLSATCRGWCVARTSCREAPRPSPSNATAPAADPTLEGRGVLVRWPQRSSPTPSRS
jgi:hypothetical protein